MIKAAMHRAKTQTCLRKVGLRPITQVRHHFPLKPAEKLAELSCSPGSCATCPRTLFLGENQGLKICDQCLSHCVERGLFAKRIMTI